MGRWVGVVGVLCLLFAGASAIAAEVEVPGNWVVVAWAPSIGLPTHYAVFVNRNGAGFPPLPEYVTPAYQRAAVLGGSRGDVISVRVAAYDEASGAVSPYSDVSQSIRFLDPLRAELWRNAPSLLTNGSFELGDDPGAFRRITAGVPWLPGWDVLGHSVDWVGSAWIAADGRRSLDLSGGSAGGVQQSFATQPGRRYALVFALAGNPLGGKPRKTLLVDVANQRATYVFDASGRSVDDMGWYSPPPLVFEAQAPWTTLQLWSGDFDDTSGLGVALDAVAVYPVQ